MIKTTIFIEVSMANPDVNVKTNQQEEITVSSHGFKMIFNGNFEPLIFESNGKPIDPSMHIGVQEKLMSSLVEKLEPLQQLEMAKKIITRMSATVAASFVSNANDSIVDVTKVGYLTKASEFLPFRVVGLGPVDDRYGNVSFVYTTDRPILKRSSWGQAKKELEKINNEGLFIKAGFGMADFPTSKLGDTGTNVLGIIYENKKELGITVDGIHGELYDGFDVCHLNCNTGHQYDNIKDNYAAVFPAWMVKHPII